MLNFGVDSEIVEAVHQTKHSLRLLLHQKVYMLLKFKKTKTLQITAELSLLSPTETHRNKPLRKQEVNIRLQHHIVDTRGSQTSPK